MDLIRTASHPFDVATFVAGKQTPVFFGSAINNFGVQEILQALVEWAPPPQPRDATMRVVAPDIALESEGGVRDATGWTCARA